MRHILVPVSPDVPCAAAVAHAAGLARRTGAELVFLHVVSPDGEAAGEPWAAVDLAGACEGLETRRLTRHGWPVQQIVSAARAESADLIVMATHERWRLGADPDGESVRTRRRFVRFLLHSITAQVMDQAPCPVWAVPCAGEAPALRHILCYLDLGRQSGQTLRRAASLAGLAQARLTLVHIAPSTQIYTAGNKTRYTQMLADSFVDIARGKLAALQAETGIAAEIIIENGEPAQALAVVARRTGADLVIAGHWRADEYWQEQSGFFELMHHSPVAVAMAQSALPAMAVAPAPSAHRTRLHYLMGLAGICTLAALALFLLYLYAIRAGCAGDPDVYYCIVAWRSVVFPDHAH